jgi:hypothetical protein
MYETVFISHSKDDPNLGFFHKIFSAVGTKAIWMEFEDIEPPPYRYIRDSINRSDAIFVLLSKFLIDRQYTNNWVSFEVGLAVNCKRSSVAPKKADLKQGLHVWLFEPSDEPVDFAIPYCTYYMRYQPDKMTLKRVKLALEKAPTGALGVPATCQRDDCKLTFYYLTKDYGKPFQCPACRKIMQVPKYWFYDYGVGLDWGIVKRQKACDRKSTEA